MSVTVHHQTLVNHIEIAVIVCVLTVILGVCLYYATAIGRLLGEAGTRITARIMGLILAAMAIEMMANGLMQLFPALAGS